MLIHSSFGRSHLLTALFCILALSKGGESNKSKASHTRSMLYWVSLHHHKALNLVESQSQIEEGSIK